MKKVMEESFTEDELIAYQMGELSRWRRWQVRRALERDSALAAEAEEIAATLRAFGADAAPVVDPAVMERAWGRVRPSLAVLAPVSRGVSVRRVWAVGLGSALAGAVLVVGVLSLAVRRVPAGGEGVANAVNGAGGPTGSLTARAGALLTELQRKTGTGRPYNNRPGPLTTVPDAVADDPTLAAHLDTAERVLTEVSHTEGSLPLETQEQVHRLLLQNAVYHQSAESDGDMATAAVIDDLGRVLTSLDAEPQQSASNDDSFRLQMSVGGVLLDLRILHHDSAATKDKKE